MNKGTYRIWKRIVSSFMTVCLTAGLMLSNVTMASFAATDTELPNENLGNGASEGTAYAWIGPRSGTGENPSTQSYRFDLCGLQAGQTGYSTSGIKTSFGWQGYATYLLVGNSAKYKANGSANGAVEDLTSLGVELKIALSPSPDNKYVFVDYYVYDKSGQGGTAGRTVKLGTGTDVMIGGSQEDDYATVYKNDRGFHMVNQHVKTTFDCITNDSSLGITPPTNRWIGHYGSWGTNVFNEGGGSSLSGTDSGMAYSWEFQLHPYEVVHKRVAFAIRDTSYYVSNSGQDSTAADGTYSSPYKTIGYALSKIGNKKGYIYIMDYPDITSPIEISGAGKDITIASTDYDRNGNPVVGTGDYIKTLKRASSYTGPIFKVTSGTLKLTDIVLDGNGAASADPLLSATSGRLEVNSGAEIQGCLGNGSSLGSAVNITGNAAFSMNYGKISGNTSFGKGAVYYNSTGRFDVINDVLIEDNVNQSGAKANVYLEDGKTITVTGDLNIAKIGVTAKKQPSASPGGISTEAAQQVTVAVPLAGSAMDTAPSPFADNFFADQGGDGGAGLYVTVGTKNLTGSGASGATNDRNAVLKRDGLQISFTVKDADTGGTINGAPAILPVSKGSGDLVEIGAPPAITGYDLVSVIVDQGNTTTLQVNQTPGSDFGKITGTMPNQDVEVEYEYRKIASRIDFNSNGGTPEPEPLVGTAGNPITSLLPSTSRYGYLFKGWSKTNDWQNPQWVTSLPAVYPESPITYYAIFEADPSIKFNYTVEHSNQTGDIVFDTNTMNEAFSVETTLAEQKQTVRGYEWSLADSGTIPTEYNYSGTSVPVGQFDNSGNFTGKMPGQDVTIRYRYKVRYGDPTAQSEFEVRHETANGITVSAAQTASYYPEAAITAQPAVAYGFKCTGYRFDLGESSGSTADGLVYSVTGTFDENLVYTGIMPNQKVQLTYLYETTLEGYEMSVQYRDNGTLDDQLKDIIPPVVTGPHPAATDVEGEYQEQYGYSVAQRQIKPDNAEITFDSGNDWSGIMPNENAQVIYQHDRISSKWADITYKTGQKGTLEAGEEVSPDVQSAGNGMFRASILINDGTAKGQENSYTLAEIKEKRLMPAAVAESIYYKFEGWFVDTNNNGVVDGDEALLPQDYRFTGPATVTASFGENPEAWIDITFEAGEHGTINAGEPTSLHTTFDKTWGGIQADLPDYTPEVNYLVDGWYAQGEPLTNETVLTKGQVYTIQFYPDPDVFGTDVSAPEAMAGLNSQGKGRVTVFGTAQGYKYILTGLDGKVIAVNKGNLLTSRTVFDNLYPGMRYMVYETTGRTAVQAGDMIGEIGGTVSEGTQVLTPVVETNYQVYYDEEDEGKTRLVINPADPSSDYAVLDSAGNVVNTPQTGAGGWQSPSGSPAMLAFTGLDYNREYTVVARPSGRTEITAESRREDGSVITTDPGGELELPVYIIETLHGEIKTVAGETVGADRFEEAHKGERVSIAAEPVNENGMPFSYWKFIIGRVDGLGISIHERNVEFTMPDANLVLAAVYERPATPSNAQVTDEVRGGSREELALDPDEIPVLEADLTTDADRELLDVNHADVTYKVVYRKNAVRAAEAAAIKLGGDYNTDHESAFRGAWGLDVSIERYVNGRRVDRASASNAEFNTYVQLEKADVDMMDYQLYELSEEPGGGLTASLVPMDSDPEDTGGLFTFRATEGKRYVMVYNRAYRLYFVNNTAPVPSRYHYYFKVRRNEAPSDSYYEAEYGALEEQLDYFVSLDGAEYNFEGWSYSQEKQRMFDPDRSITRKTYVYAYYKDNVKEVDDTRQKLEQAILDAIGMSDDHFLKLAESQKIKDCIEAALEVLDQEGPRATIGQLLDALNELKEQLEPYEKLLEERYNHYDNIQENGNKGGSKGGGGGGSGSKAKPFNSTAPRSYLIGTNGEWIESIGPAGEKQLSFRLNGGNCLNAMWARLEYPDKAQAEGNGWYRFDHKGIMQTGWFFDETGSWFYCNTEQDGYAGRMATGWKQDRQDGNWYYLDPVSGAMAQGWRLLDGKWYFFSPTGAGVYIYNPSQENWFFGGGNGRPLGSMYVNEMTPDGYLVGADGAWIQ